MSNRRYTFWEWCLQRNLHFIALVDKANLVIAQPSTLNIMHRFSVLAYLVDHGRQYADLKCTSGESYGK